VHHFIKIIFLPIFFFLLFISGGYASADNTQIEATLKEMSDFSDVNQDFQKNIVSELSRSYSSGAPRYDELPRYIKVIKLYDQTYKPKLIKEITAFQEKWGTDAVAASAKVKAIINPNPSGLPRHYQQPDATIRSLNSGLKEVEETRKGTLIALVNEINRETATFSLLLGSTILQTDPDKYTEVLKSVNEIVSDISLAEQAIQKFKDELNKSIKAEEIKISKNSFPDKHIKLLEGDADELAASILEWARNSPGWGLNTKYPKTILAVAITGQWRPTKHSITGETIQWGLPILLATQNEDIKNKHLVRAFQLTAKTQNYAGVKKSPPWSNVSVGSNYLFKEEKLENLSSGKSTGFIAQLLWFILSLLAIISGFIGAKGLLKNKHSLLKSIYDALSPLSITIGLAALLIAVLSFTWSILSLSIFSNIIPQVATLLMGLLLAKEIVTKKMKQTAESEGDLKKGAKMAMAQQEKLEQLSGHQTIVGLITLLIGLIYLFTSGSFYFI
jgi:uncharacterized protein YukE